jgi:hypothetical protein
VDVSVQQILDRVYRALILSTPPVRATLCTFPPGRGHCQGTFADYRCGKLSGRGRKQDIEPLRHGNVLSRIRREKDRVLQ